MSSSVLADPKVLVLIAGVVLTVIAFGTLHGFSAVLALALIVFAGFAIFRRGIKLEIKLAGLVLGLLIVLVSNGIEGWQESKSQEKADEQTKQQVAGAQAPNTSSTSAQHANTEKTAQGTMTNPKEPTAIIETTAGNITCTLFPGQTPLTVANFIGLSNGTKDWKDPKTGQTVHGVPLYNGTIFHRVIPNFMIQGGDPVGNGSGDPGYSFKDEFSPSLTFDQPGRLAMANSGPGTNGSQFFITEVPTPHLNNHHTIFGQCQDLDVVKKIARLPADPRNNRPYDPPKIVTIKIIQPHHATAKPAPTSKPSTTKSTTPPSQ